ncbi:galactose-1-phosphate uridylyltransferase [Vespertiliibacter pulmonis]|uniref:Galactose-1-phosphate uridylyltransferase n=1 Tax=Vespertiliibacter pulmonis TaxID=1443036 RepID=A0A3N4VXX9_9PAST|nr:galactose-1-phosphate uridylyltransferase [Vespertiliibacter pulmonis]QLB20226.1 galactose-1-phosphate uridylyltransferase [Vespertiliibacter pulmonis]RPE86203.1 UTP-hexose-1-phosphate uridylyltransferase /UDP-glucose-hexose-1-phosphate uridylyltransferase [Vespertiliibacter pulmonis]
MSQSLPHSELPHRRFNPLKNQWVLVSPHRAKRPWQGQQEILTQDEKPSYDPDCYLCPSNKRITGENNPNYVEPFVFKNDFSALLPEISCLPQSDEPLFKLDSVQGESYVICFSPDHSKTLPLLTSYEIEKIIQTWQGYVEKLGKNYQWVQLFENKGEMMGCSNPHPHGQIWASDFIPNEILTEDQCQKDYFEQYGSPLLIDYAQKELKFKERIVVETEDWLAVVPFWASWPFETLLLPKEKRFTNITQLNQAERSDLALALKQLTTRYDNLFNISFPYSMGFHFAPLHQEDNTHWQLHAHFYPPLLRSATVRKFMVGYEMLAEAQRDLTPEQAAERLRVVSGEIHYKFAKDK